MYKKLLNLFLILISVLYKMLAIINLRKKMGFRMENFFLHALILFSTLN